MFPQSLIVDFWQKVQNLLEKEHGLPRARAEEGISQYLALSERHQFTDLIYHRNPSEIAGTIAAALEHEGFQSPLAGEVKSR